MMQQPQQPIGGMPVSITLTVNEWSRLADILGTHPWNQVNPFIMRIAQAMQAGVQPQPSQPAPEPQAETANG